MSSCRASVVAVSTLVVSASLGLPGAALACGSRSTAPTSALPASGAVDVSPQTSVIVVGPASLPPELTLEANGVVAPLPAISVIGDGIAPLGLARYWRLAAELAPSTDYVLRARDGNVPRVLTSFRTAATYDKAPATPPVLTALHLWQVRYDTAGRGDCVFDEVEGYIDLEHSPGALPGTPAEEAVQVVTLSPKGGGATQSFVFPGGSRFPSPLEPSIVPGGAGQLTTTSAAIAVWKPVLLAGREYCAAVELIGRNDRALGPVRSNVVCAPVVVVDNRTAHDDAGAAPSAGRDAAAPIAADAAVTTDPPPVQKNSGGCRFASGSGTRACDLVPPLVALAWLVRRRRLSATRSS